MASAFLSTWRLKFARKPVEKGYSSTRTDPDEISDLELCETLTNRSSSRGSELEPELQLRVHIKSRYGLLRERERERERGEGRPALGRASRKKGYMLKLLVKIADTPEMAMMYAQKPNAAKTDGRAAKPFDRLDFNVVTDL